ncbi:MAG TPA: biotin--protein ligase [Thermomicrobiales bacterium]|jgi:lipoate-protein ligase A|nr:biotin--protein ligase [Thermomicrobiales bacterium]
MHGAFKTPGGKLVQVDFDVEDERLRNVEVTGDFFLYPEEALTAITASVEGSPADMPIAERTATIAAAIPPGVEWLGSSPEALAAAIERALLASLDTYE